jgi:beta-xylosidase
MKKHLSFILFLLFTVNGFAQNERNVNKSFCNPLDLNYRFRPEEPSRREAADPAVIRYKDKYILFASKTGGYWVSDNLTDWDFITNNVLPWEDYAPAAVATGDTVYFMAYNVAGRFSGIFKSINPLKGEWELVKDSYPFFVGDPDLFLDDDGRLYLFYGLSNFIPVRGVELNRSTLDPVGEPTDLFLSNREEYGWERTGDYNENAHKKPWIEGPWITKVQ